MAETFGISLNTQIIVGKQLNRANLNIDNMTVENYYKITVSILYIDSFLSELEDRFKNHKSVFEGLYLCNIYTFLP